MDLFFIGINTASLGRNAVCAIIRKRLKNARNHYCIKKLFEIQPSVIVETVETLYDNPEYTVRKRVFSQDRRPKKDVNARPKIVLCHRQGDGDIAERLRTKGIPVENMLVTTGGTRSSGGLTRPGEGRNHFVPERELAEFFSSILQQERLVADIKQPDKNTLAGEMAELMTGSDLLNIWEANVVKRDILLAVAAPVWFRETIRYSRAYRTGARNMRQFI